MLYVLQNAVDKNIPQVYAEALHGEDGKSYRMFRALGFEDLKWLDNGSIYVIKEF